MYNLVKKVTYYCTLFPISYCIEHNEGNLREIKAKAVLSSEIPRNILWSNLGSRDGGRGYL
jgi:hypothetical protein